MKTDTFKFEYDGKEYDVFVIYKSQRNTYFRLKDDGFHITSSYFVSRKKIIEALNKFAPRLIKSSLKNSSHYSFEEDYIYLLGEKRTLSEFEIKNDKDLDKFLKSQALEVITGLVRKYEKIMSISSPYKVGVRKTTTRFGSNSLKTHALSFQIDLIHYSKEIISTVVVHELAHDFYRNHQQKFYDCVYLYCPNYKVLQKKLKKGIHK